MGKGNSRHIKSVIWKGGPHWSILVPSGLVIILALFSAYVGLSLFESEIRKFFLVSKDSYSYFHIGSYLLIIIGSYFYTPFFQYLWEYFTTENILTDNTLFTYHIDLRRFKSVEDRMSVYRIVDYRPMQGLFFQKVFGCGDILLLTLDKTTPELLISNIPNHRYVAEKIYQIAENHRDRQSVQELNIT